MEPKPYICLDCGTGYDREAEWKLCCHPSLGNVSMKNLLKFLSNPEVGKNLHDLGVTVTIRT